MHSKEIFCGMSIALSWSRLMKRFAKLLMARLGLGYCTPEGNKHRWYPQQPEQYIGSLPKNLPRKSSPGSDFPTLAEILWHSLYNVRLSMNVLLWEPSSLNHHYQFSPVFWLQSQRSNMTFCGSARSVSVSATLQLHTKHTCWLFTADLCNGAYFRRRHNFTEPRISGEKLRSCTPKQL